MNEVYKKHGVVPSLVMAPGFVELTADTTHAIKKALKAPTMMDGQLFTRGAVGIVDDTINEIISAWSAAGVGNDPDLVVWGHPSFGVEALYPEEWYALTLLDNAKNTGGVIGVNPASNEIINETVPEDPFIDSEVNTLNEAGINGFVQFDAFRTWGNVTSNYGTDKSELNNFDSIRYILNRIRNNVNIYARKLIIEKETSVRKIQNYANNMQKNFIDPLVRQGAILSGSKIEFRAEDNDIADLLTHVSDVVVLKSIGSDRNFINKITTVQICRCTSGCTADNYVNSGQGFFTVHINNHTFNPAVIRSTQCRSH